MAYIPSPEEARGYYYGLPSRPRLVARSSATIWHLPTGAFTYPTPKELIPVGLHPLNAVWEDTVGPAMVHYLNGRGIQYTSLDPVRFGTADDPSPPVIIWLGVIPGSLSAQDGINVAIDCKAILSANGIEDVDVEIRESQVISSAKLYNPDVFDHYTAEAREPFSATLGIPICGRATPRIQGTAAFFFTDSTNHPGKLYLLTARHVLFDPYQDNTLYKYDDPSQPKKEVCLLGDAGFKDCIEVIEHAILDKQYYVDVLNHQLQRAGSTASDDKSERPGEHRKSLERKLASDEYVMQEFKVLLDDVKNNWQNPEDQVIGHVILSPPITFNAGNKSFTEDWAVIEVDSNKIDKSTFVGNAIHLGEETPQLDLKKWMPTNQLNPPSFEWPLDCLLRFSGTMSDEEMYHSNPSNTVNPSGDTTIMVLQRGRTSGLTFGRLNTLRSFTRQYCEDEPAGETSKEVAVFALTGHERVPRPFSKLGDSGSCVVDGKGNVAGMLTGGAGAPDRLDVAYLTSANFILERLAVHGFEANLFNLGAEARD
ncbi:hypothetical protein NP233_g6713 [Leucocoprinus birnbaumii]|uniref:Uncharacterized protein n=1 Tax=Leucocoprinus birnbaumii TaxID=56174 RepID=A0AAD5VQP9_9AGAR|nr:hypothetical protein NP233_g6713 [Leucocoprinus birnbaumii]